MDADAADAGRACDIAADAFPAWAALGPNTRRMFLLKAAEALEARAPDFVGVMMAEIGATAGIAEFIELRWITVDTQHVHYPI